MIKLGKVTEKVISPDLKKLTREVDIKLQEKAQKVSEGYDSTKGDASKPVFTNKNISSLDTKSFLK